MFSHHDDQMPLHVERRSTFTTKHDHLLAVLEQEDQIELDEMEESEEDEPQKDHLVNCFIVNEQVVLIT